MTFRKERAGGAHGDRIGVGAALLLGLLCLAGCGVSCSKGAKGGGEAAPPAALARFSLIEGAVSVKPRGQEDWKNATAEQLLNKDDLIRTGPKGTAEITFFDNTVIRVGPNSLIAIEEAPQDPATLERQVKWHVRSGEVDFRTPKKRPGRHEAGARASTPTLTADMAELTKGGMRVEQTGASDLRVLEGSGQVQTNTGQRIPVGAAEGIKVDAKSIAGAITKLPFAPVLLRPAHQAVLRYRDPAMETTVLEWRPVDGVTYRVMVDQSAHFKLPFVDQKGIQGTTVDVRGLAEGDYFWRVASVRDGLEGPFSDYARLTVQRPTAAEAKPPKLVIDSFDVRANQLSLKGLTVHGASVTVNGQRLEVRPDGTFSDIVLLEKAGAQVVVVQAISLDGGVAEKKLSVVVRF